MSREANIDIGNHSRPAEGRLSSSHHIPPNARPPGEPENGSTRSGGWPCRSSGAFGPNMPSLTDRSWLHCRPPRRRGDVGDLVAQIDEVRAYSGRVGAKLDLQTQGSSPSTLASTQQLSVEVRAISKRDVEPFRVRLGIATPHISRGSGLPGRGRSCSNATGRWRAGSIRSGRS
jgi:hypothetical protein